LLYSHPVLPGDVGFTLDVRELELVNLFKDPVIARDWEVKTRIDDLDKHVRVPVCTVLDLVV
jgi:hypothetical protein